jgi:hypothetical protein
MSPRSVQPAWSSQRSVTNILPSTVPRTFTDLALISPRMRACSPIVSVPVESIVPSTSPSMSSEFTNLTEPLIETPRERRALDGVGMNGRLDGTGTTDGSGQFVCGGSVALRGEKRVKGCTARIVPNHSAFWKENVTTAAQRGEGLGTRLAAGGVSSVQSGHMVSLGKLRASVPAFAVKGRLIARTDARKADSEEAHSKPIPNDPAMCELN